LGSDWGEERGKVEDLGEDVKECNGREKETVGRWIGGHFVGSCCMG
jgi:hypothetical protein